MSVSKRKIGLYSFEFVNELSRIKLEHDFLKSYFTDLLNTIENDGFESKKVTLTQSQKFYYFVDHEEDNDIVCIRFESAKVGHRPNLVDETTGLKRSNPKGLHEGEAEVTHIAIKFNNDHMIVALEERMAGITIGQFSAYLNRYIGRKLHEEQYLVEYNIIPYDGFERHLQEFGRIKVGHIIVDKQDLGSDFLNIANLGRSVRTPVELVFKSHVGDSISRELIRFWDGIRGRTHQIQRIRIEGESHEGAKIRLDTDSLKMVKHLDAELIEETGIVESEDLFSKLVLLLREM